MSTHLDQPVIIDNKPGGGGVIGMSEVKHQPVDGYTLVFPSILTPHIYKVNRSKACWILPPA